jgi:hypothetical protein
MEEVIDFDEWVKNYTPVVVEYVAVFDPITGVVKSVGPKNAFEQEKNKISIDAEVAESILSAELHIHNCLVDINSNTLEIAEVKNLNKIDDILHRITSIQYADSKNPDIYLTYNSVDKTLKIELSEEFNGTKELAFKVKKRNVVWDGDTDMDFVITEYNDPNCMFKLFSVKINDLIENFKIIDNIDYPKFSVYTRRLFKNYVIEYK